jgi:3-hydroxyisobutyrate dehydrogenase
MIIMSDNKPVLGFIGIGLMGSRMSQRLLNAEYSLSIWNRTQEKMDALCSQGARRCRTLKELTQQSDILLLCLANTQVVENILEQIEPFAKNNQIIIDLSSIDPAQTRQFADRMNQYGVHWVDAPVSGGTAGAEQGTLAIMAGGESHAVAVAQTILKPLYQQFTHMGPVGSGQVTKVCNQMIVSCNMLVIAEMMALAEAAGVETAKIPTALKGGFADSKPLQIAGPEMTSRCFEPIKWTVETLLKDLNLAVELSKRHQSAVPMSGLAHQLMQLHAQQGYRDQDPSTLIQLFSDLSC